MRYGVWGWWMCVDGMAKTHLPAILVTPGTHKENEDERRDGHEDAVVEGEQRKLSLDVDAFLRVSRQVGTDL